MILCVLVVVCRLFFGMSCLRVRRLLCISSSLLRDVSCLFVGWLVVVR